jgi:hypothetical protein
MQRQNGCFDLRSKPMAEAAQKHGRGQQPGAHGFQLQKKYSQDAGFQV